MTALMVMQPADDESATEMLVERGHAPICHILRMEMPLADYRRPVTPIPCDVDLVPFDEERDGSTVFAAFQAANPTSRTEEAQWWSDMCDDPSMPYDPALWFVARTGDEIVGFALGARYEVESGSVGYVAEVGVRPERRGEGIAFAALTSVIAAFADAKLPTAALDVDVDNLTGALRLYRKAGMAPAPQATEWANLLH